MSPKKQFPGFVRRNQERNVAPKRRGADRIKAECDMEFIDEGIVLSARAHGETNAVADIFTALHGRWSGLVYGGQGRRMQPILQAGNEVRAVWKGRLDESLGHYSLELVHSRAGALLHDRTALAALSAACAVAGACLPEREPHAPAYRAMAILLAALEDIDLWPPIFARWELGLLAELGFGLSLDRCAATGQAEDLVYVSPRSGRAVSAEAGEPYKDKLFRLPAFFQDGAAGATMAEAIGALELSGYFIETRILHAANKELPEARRRLRDLLMSHTTGGATENP